jgi:geranylgeranyl reductase family protein
MKYDVVVVGAGPAGSTAAKFLSEKGIHVLLLDKSSFPRDKPCGGGLPARVIKRYKYLEENALIDSYSYQIRLHSFSLKHKIDIEKNEPIVAMVLRNTFDEGLANLATRNGAVFLTGKPIKHIKISEEKTHLTLIDGTEIESHYVIAADGIWGSFGKQLGIRQSSKNIGVCIVEEFPLPKTTLDQYLSEKRQVHIHLNFQGVAGYGWVFPKAEHINIGICEFRQAIGPKKEKKNIKNIYENYLKILKETKLIPPTLQSKNPKGGVFPTSPVEQTSLDRVLLCGDAAGMVNPLTGEGIYSAMVSGEIAAEVIKEALESGITNKKILQGYQARWKRDFGDDNKRFFRWSQQWGMGKENIVRLFGKDSQLVDIAMKHVMTQESMKTYRWKLARRFLSIYLKDRFGFQ